MRLIKGFLFVASGFLILITCISLLIPSRVMTAKTVVIHAQPQRILAAINDLQAWKQWHPVLKIDSSSVLISNPSTGVNASAEWSSSNKINNIIITGVIPQGIKFSLIRPGENPVENTLTYVPLQEAGTYQVEWKALTKLKWYPWEKFAGIFVGEITGPGYEVALTALKNYTEQHQ